MGLGLSQPLCREQVTFGDIRSQTQVVKEAEENLTLASMAGGVVREAERKRNQERPKGPKKRVDRLHWC